MTKANTFRLLLSFALLVVVVALPAHAARRGNQFSANLQGFQEVPATMTLATGHFDAEINSDGTEITYTLTYANLKGNATQSHIHAAQPNVNGGIMVFFCSNLGNGPAGTPACPAKGGTLTGKIHASDVIGITSQAISAGDLSGLLRALRNGLTYVNVHSDQMPGGEIRGQVLPGRGKDLELDGEDDSQ